MSGTEKPPRLIEEWRDVAQLVAQVRLDRYDTERQLRLIDYAAAWQRKWDEQEQAAASAARERYYVVGR
jgi:hypothetical protein